MIMLVHMLQHPLKRTQKHSNGKSFPTRRIAQTLLLPIIISSDQCNMAWLTSTSPTTMNSGKAQRVEARSNFEGLEKAPGSGVTRDVVRTWLGPVGAVAVETSQVLQVLTPESWLVGKRTGSGPG
ncbi:hypothetical protein LAZ67_2006614 [Cordylochernes scorpioides]|uniref:Uncharacterized protein n=1 Tax=Cordylochernes scorpioides TaxID=51811 RepID=A0ABY6K6D6_9ARAC|nr:hypothetical protein LAZ67_2006614 [Cordylochernes scorpioides]